MAQKFKVVRCPICTLNIRLPLDTDLITCPHCNTQLVHSAKDDDAIDTLDATHCLDKAGLDPQNNPLNDFTNSVYLSPAKQVLKVLRSYRADCPQWFSIHKVYYCCIIAGLLPDEVRETIDKLVAEEFIEKREDTIRAIPIN